MATEAAGPPAFLHAAARAQRSSHKKFLLPILAVSHQAPGRRHLLPEPVNAVGGAHDEVAAAATIFCPGSATACTGNNFATANVWGRGRGNS